MWVHGSTKHCKENTLKYMGGGNLFSVMILLNYGCVLPNRTAHSHILQCSTVLLVNPNPFLNGLVSPYPLFTADCGLNFYFQPWRKPKHMWILSKGKKRVGIDCLRNCVIMTRQVFHFGNTKEMYHKIYIWRLIHDKYLVNLKNGNDEKRKRNVLDDIYDGCNELYD